MHKAAPIWLAKAVVLCLLGSTGDAATIASTFGPGDTFSSPSYVIGSPVLQQEIGAIYLKRDSQIGFHSRCNFFRFGSQ